MRKLFSKTWQNRDEGLNEVEDIIMNQNQLREDEAFVGGIGAVKITVADKMAGVAQKSMNLLGTITQNFPGVSLDGNSRSEFAQYTEPILTTLVEKLGDNL